MNMEYSKLGKTDMKVSRVTHGCMELGGFINDTIKWEAHDEAHHIQLLTRAFDEGVTSFDTAEVYGHGTSEAIVGKALKPIRNQCVIATKVSPDHLRPEDLRKAAINSLKRLQTDYIDLYYLHWPNNAIPLSDTMGEMARLKEEGLIRAIGVSNFPIATLKQAIQYAEISASQMEFNLLSREIEQELLPFCSQNSISMFSYNSIAKGVLSGAYHFHGATLAPDDFRWEKVQFRPESIEAERGLLELLKNIADANGTTISQVVLTWSLMVPGISSVIVGTLNEKHFLENIRACGVPLSHNVFEAVSEESDQAILALNRIAKERFS